MLIREEEAKKAQQDRKRVLEKYCEIIELNRPASLEEIMDLEEDAWQY